MEKILFLDLKDEELYKYLFSYKKGKYEPLEIKGFPLNIEGDFPAISSDNNPVCLSLPVSFLNFRVLELPFSEKDRIDEVLKYELEGKILNDINEVVFDSVIVGRVDNRYRVLVIYLEKQRLKSILSKLNARGIDPYCITSIEVRSIADEFSIDKIIAPVSLKVEERVEIAKEDLRSPVINLRKDEFVYKKDVEKEKKVIRVTVLLLILLLSINLINFLVNFISLKKEEAFIRDDIKRMYQSVFPHERNVFNEIYQIKSHIKELESKEDIFLGISPLKVLLDFSKLERNGLVINELMVDKINIVVKGEAPSLSVIQEFKDNLSRIYSEVNVSESKELVQGRMGFTIVMKEKML